jgi:SAM-dependent methyltransferase
VIAEGLQLLNVGCGRHFHSAWRNIDVVSCAPAVEAHDLRRGLPAQANCYDMVYHSHVLEHLTHEDGQRLIEDCHRVLKPGGVLRIVVPDLEQITRGYLVTLEEAWRGLGDESESAAQAELRLAKYQWMKLELLDQMVRQTSGGLMGKTMQSAQGDLAEFISQRLGREVTYARAESPVAEPAKNRSPNQRRPPWRERWAKKILKWAWGANGWQWLQVGKFLDSGEVHRWMYDRVSLRELTQKCRFKDFRVCSATESYLPGFADYELDQVAGTVRKPDSIFVECRKPPQ